MIYLFFTILNFSFVAPIMLNAYHCKYTQTQNFCDNHCLDVATTAKYFCYLKAQNLEANTAYINSATIGNLHVVTNDTTDGTLTAENITVNGNVNINGTFIVDGEQPFVSVSQYGYFYRTTSTGAVANNGILQFNQTLTANGITNNNGVITISETGFYIVNFMALIPGNQTTVRLVFDPAGLQTPVPNGQFMSQSGGSPTQVIGLVIVEITAPNTTIGVINASGGGRAFAPIGVVSESNNTLSIQIAKLVDL